MLVLGLDWEHLVTDKPHGHSKDLISMNSVALGVGAELVQPLPQQGRKDLPSNPKVT